MVDPRIYRAGWVIVFVALIVFGFSLENRPAAARTSLAPGVSFSTAAGDAQNLADTYGVVSAGSERDDAMAATLARELRTAGGFSVATSTDVIHTADGERAIRTVEARRPGLAAGTIAVIADRDAARPSAHSGSDPQGAIAATASSAILVDLARQLSGSTLNRSLLLISTSGAAGASGTSQIARSLAGQDVDAVIVLGDLAGAQARRPIVVPWSGTSLLAPALLTSTLGNYVSGEADLSAANPSMGSEFAQLAFPFATGGQAPFARLGIPAVGLSMSGDRSASVVETVDPARLARLGLALDQTVTALDAGGAVPAPAAYLTISTKLIPLWAVRLLILGMIAPVAFTLVDALARARRRGHSILSWVVWVISGIVPFVVGLAIVRIAGLSHALSAPAGAVAGGVGFSLAGALTLAVAIAAVAVSFRLLRPLGVQVASGIGWRREPETPLIEGAVVALAIVLCALALILWVVNPFAAALLVPALHMWLWLGSPGVVAGRLRAAALLLAGLILPALVAVYYMLALGLAPWDFFWSLTLALAGGAVGISTWVSWSVALGVLAGAIVLLARASGASAAVVDAPVTIRGPLGYAGPGSLGGTGSALRR